MTTAAPAGHACEHEHIVEFYETDSGLARSVARFMAPALLGDGAAIVVATPEHRAAFAEALAAAGVDVTAAERGGHYVAVDAAGLLAAYHPAVAGSGGKTYSRDSTHLVSSPTDLQAEVLVPGPIPLSAVQAVATRTVEQAATDVAILARLSLPVGSVRWVVAPLMFEPYRLATAIPSRPSPG